MAVLRAQRHHDPAQGEFQPYAGVAVDHALHKWHFYTTHICRRSYGRFHLRSPQRIVVEDLDTLVYAPSVAQEAGLFPTEGFSLLRQFIRTLPQLRRRRDRILLVAILAGENYTTIARRLGISKQAISESKKRLFAQLRTLLQGQEDLL